MPLSSKKPRFAFCSASEALNEETDSSPATKAPTRDNEDLQPQLNHQEIKNFNPIRRHNLDNAPHCQKGNSNSTLLTEHFTILLTLRGTQYYRSGVLSLASGCKVIIQREPDNKHDSNAIRVSVLAASKEPHQVGHIAKEQALLLAPLLDTNRVQIHSMVVTRMVVNPVDGLISCRLKAKGSASNLPDVLSILQHPMLSNIPNIEKSLGLAQVDLDASKGAHYSASELNQPIEYDCPPSSSALRALGMGCADDEVWWSETAGLKAPVHWNLSGAHDLLLDKVSLSQTHRDKVKEVMDGAIHGVTNVWLDESLTAMRKAMHSDDFWCHRCNDAYIRVFGGHYVLGQEAENLTLVKGAPHTDLTSMICRAHNLVYAACHGELPVDPGFNTIVFGLNLRCAGFHFHQDSIGELHAKNAPLLPRQPVATTVFYERPDLDEKKEVVNWRPIHNWSATVPKAAKTKQQKENTCYLAARSIQTAHGMVHVQRAGLQARAKHGIFHTPHGTTERQGYRTAITARIACPDFESRVEQYVASKSYSTILGPDGEFTLPASTVIE